MNYEEWKTTVPEEIKADSLWKMTAYRLALFLSDLGWRDTAKLMRDRRMIRLSDQLYGALGSVSANLAEGYSRGTGKDRARFYEYALGSARESRDWYFKARHVSSVAACSGNSQRPIKPPANMIKHWTPYCKTYRFPNWMTLDV
jgi:four helix bundle protein